MPESHHDPTKHLPLEELKDILLSAPYSAQLEILQRCLNSEILAPIVREEIQKVKDRRAIRRYAG